MIVVTCKYNMFYGSYFAMYSNKNKERLACELIVL